jgi:lipopolysaccharide biosynthesis regulator YciM
MVRDWPQAIALAQQMGQETGDAGGGLAREIAQFHCELATQAMAGQAPDRLAVAGREITAALLADPDHPRPLLLRGEQALAEGDAAGAITHWSLLLRRHPAHAALVARGCRPMPIWAAPLMPCRRSCRRIRSSPGPTRWSRWPMPSSSSRVLRQP